MKTQSPRILFVCTEDWFFYSHFLPLIKAAKEIEGSRVMLATTTGGRHEDIECLGVEIFPINFDRASTGALSTIRLLWQLSQLLRQERPDLVHFIALKPVLLGGLVRLFSRPIRAIYHITGLGTLAEGTRRRKQWLGALVFSLPGLYMRSKKSWLLVENPDDASYLRDYWLSKDASVSILGGAGVDPDKYQPLTADEKSSVNVTFVGRMIATKGVDVLVEAMDLLADTHPFVLLQLYGLPDPANPGSYEEQTLKCWGRKPNVTWHGYSSDIVNICRQSDICVVPTRTREGMPRAMLEAASCARPLIVTDVPGCRHFIRDGVEGIIVPPEDPTALASAIVRLAESRELRRKMALAARQRVLAGYTEQHVIRAVADVYGKLLEK